MRFTRKKIGGLTAKLPVKHNAKQSTKAVAKGISEFPVKRMNIVNTQGSDDCKCRLKQVQESRFMQAKPPSPRIMTLVEFRGEVHFNLFYFATNSPVMFVAFVDFCLFNKLKFTHY